MNDTTAASEPQIQRIVGAIRNEEQRLRTRYTFLKYQDWIGFGIMLLSLAGMLASGYAFYVSLLPAWVCIVLSAIFASLSHEIEHDLIHRQYFRRNALMHNLMMLVVWLMRPNTVSPWYRRGMHILHHKTSGTQHDLEEQLVGNGISYAGITRYIVMFDSLMGILLRGRRLKKNIPNFSALRLINSAFPMSIVYYGGGYLFLLFHTYDALAGSGQAYPLWLSQGVRAIDFLVVVLLAPNFLRSGCLHFVTSAMHYHGNVTSVMRQTQILKPWFFTPLQLFCFNFGSTHSIHHFVVGQPFYLRQMVARAAHKVMLSNGVRLNDLSTFSHANAWVESAHPRA